MVTCGVLNSGDADQEVAEALDIAYVSQPPFSHVTPDSDLRHRELIASADVVVLTDVPVGNGNLPNVEAARDAAREGKQVVLLKPDLIGDRDFTGGAGTKAVEEALLRRAGVRLGLWMRCCASYE